MHARFSQLVPIAAGLLILTACGPTKEALVSMKSVPVPILLRAQPTATPSAQATPVSIQAPVVPVGGGVAIVPAPVIVPTPGGTPSAPGAACPDLSPLAVPAREATASIATKAVEGRFGFRNAGTLNGKAVGAAVRAVSAANASSQGPTQTFTFTVTEQLGSLVTRSTYQALYASASTVVTGELDLLSVEDNRNYKVSFQPPGLRILQTPADVGVNWRSAANDAASATTYTLDGTINKRVLVNACGSAVDSWNVTGSLTAVGPAENVTYAMDYNVATGYGGFIVRESRKASGGTRYGAAWDEDLTSTISQANPY